MKITIFLAALSVASGVLAASSKTGAKAAKEESTNMTRAYDDSAAPEAKRAGKVHPSYPAGYHVAGPYYPGGFRAPGVYYSRIPFNR
ncbi:hypothetical protein PSHT_00520 [Puccinia striiformis]|uniref:Uncharacterized protein n=2 Tax=Puccinia striiformis TaxID=27350 RepID=A0A0L0UT87_9BASI|nr:hypothetical protein PSTG_16299 [Puccinia striiformis f. sp. tritici PST-78]POW23040.1 hypothetical protein PSHT_00520 [Puccinia striiformis]